MYSEIEFEIRLTEDQPEPPAASPDEDRPGLPRARPGPRTARPSSAATSDHRPSHHHHPNHRPSRHPGQGNHPGPTTARTPRPGATSAPAATPGHAPDRPAPDHRRKPAQ